MENIQDHDWNSLCRKTIDQFWYSHTENVYRCSASKHPPPLISWLFYKMYNIYYYFIELYMPVVKANTILDSQKMRCHGT